MVSKAVSGVKTVIEDDFIVTNNGIKRLGI